MLAVSSPFFLTNGHPLEDPISPKFSNDLFLDAESSQTFLNFRSSQPQIELDISLPSTGDVSNPTIAKKLNHNASERARRRKVNCLYSSLRSILPAADQKKKLSNPATISRVLSYLPELQQQVEGLMGKKEGLLSIVNGQEDLIHRQNAMKACSRTSSSTISVTRLNEREVVIQICTKNAYRKQLSETVLVLDEDSLVLINASSFESFDGRMLFFHLHLQVESTYRLEPDILSEKLLSLYDLRDDLFFQGYSYS